MLAAAEAEGACSTDCKGGLQRCLQGGTRHTKPGPSWLALDRPRTASWPAEGDMLEDMLCA